MQAFFNGKKAAAEFSVANGMRAIAADVAGEGLVGRVVEVHAQG